MHGKTGARAGGRLSDHRNGDNGITSSEEYVLVVQPPGTTPAVTSVTLSTEPDPVSYNASAQSYTATVTGGSNPTGYVQFSLGDGSRPFRWSEARHIHVTDTLDVGDYTVSATTQETPPTRRLPPPRTSPSRPTRRRHVERAVIDCEWGSRDLHGHRGLLASLRNDTKRLRPVRPEQATATTRAGSPRWSTARQPSHRPDDDLPAGNEVDATFMPWSDGPGDFANSSTQ